jgi:hypothetical protein
VAQPLWLHTPDPDRIPSFVRIQRFDPERCRFAAKTWLFPTFSGQPFGPEAFAVGVKRLLRSFMVAHGLLRFGSAGSVAGLPLFGGEDSGRSVGLAWKRMNPSDFQGSFNPIRPDQKLIGSYRHSGRMLLLDKSPAPCNRKRKKRTFPGGMIDFSEFSALPQVTEARCRNFDRPPFRNKNQRFGKDLATLTSKFLQLSSSSGPTNS